MTPTIERLAAHFGVRLSERSCENGFLFDGETIALNGAKCVDYDKKRDKLITAPYAFLEHDILHEIAHFVVANPEQKDLPEYGLGFNPVACNVYAPQVVDTEEANIQESMAQFLCVLWGRAYGIRSQVTDDPKRVCSTSWEQYLRYKTNEDLFVAEKWAALFRLEAMGLLTLPF